MVATSIAISNNDNMFKLGEYDLNVGYSCWNKVVCSVV
jgi:hypothetical protein